MLDVRYDSPSYHGFIYSASINEAGDYWGSMLRYANEFNGFRKVEAHITDWRVSEPARIK